MTETAYDGNLLCGGLRRAVKSPFHSEEGNSSVATATGGRIVGPVLRMDGIGHHDCDGWEVVPRNSRPVRAMAAAFLLRQRCHKESHWNRRQAFSRFGTHRVAGQRDRAGQRRARPNRYLARSVISLLCRHGIGKPSCTNRHTKASTGDLTAKGAPGFTKEEQALFEFVRAPRL